MNKWNEWIMDVTDWPKYCFCPYEPETGNVVLGMNVIQDRCPGKLAGIYHGDGNDFAATWCNENPTWRELYSPNDPN